MTTLVLAATGTLGDHLPLFALGRALRARGHAVTAAVNVAMHDAARAAGLEVARFGRPLGPEQARKAARHWDHLDAPRPPTRLAITRFLLRATRELGAATRGARLLLAGTNALLPAALLQERTGLPWAAFALMPDTLRVPEPPDEKARRQRVEAEARLEAALADTRAALGLPPRRCWRPWTSVSRALLATSPAFHPVPADEGQELVQTGFWAERGAPPPLPPALERFLDAGDDVLALSFSSQPLLDPGRVVRVHARAAALTGHRLVVQRGWAGFSARHLPREVDLRRVLFVGAVPHDRLFPRVQAAFVHGGIGTIAAAIRSGCPLVVEPWGNDQFGNAARVLRLGLGAAVHPQRTTPEGLARVLAKVLRPEVRERCRRLGEQLKEERGLESACETVEHWLGVSRA